MANLLLLYFFKQMFHPESDAIHSEAHHAVYFFNDRNALT